MEEPLVVVYEAPDEFLSRTVKEALEGAGLRVVELVDQSPSGARDFLGFSVFHGRYSRLMTLESDAETARRIVADFLAAYERGDLTLPE